MTDVNRAIEQATSETIQSRVTQDVNNVFVVNWLARAGLTLPPWWSPSRDVELRRFWKKSDHLSGALYTMMSKMAAIPHKVVPVNPSNRDDVDAAQRMTDIITGSSQFGDGWESFYSKFVEEYLSQDNGVFVEIIAPGRKDGPITGRPISVAHLDSNKAVRTGNAIFPVIYEDTDGKRYKLHYTRVMLASQMGSPIAEMFSVGFSAVSRCINVAQTLIDILVYKQEKLGSRPHRQLIITKGGLDPEDLRTAFELAESNLDAQGLTRYSKVVVGGSSAMPEAGLDVVELSSLPEGFDEQTSTILGMATIALAFGVDARELFPAMASGATRADALVQHLKQRGKGPGQIIQITERMFNYKFLPTGLRFMFDFQDDAQDRQVAEIQKIRSDRRVQDSTTGASSQRALREQMVNDGELNRDQFETLEAESGRTADGMPIESLFYSKAREYSQYLDMGVEDPLDIRNNDETKMLDTISEKRRETLEAMANDTKRQNRWVAQQSYNALNFLEILYLGEPDPRKIVQVAGTGEYVDPRVRNEDETSPTTQDRSEGEQIERADETSDDKPE